MRAVVVIITAGLAGCGRIAFDPTSNGSGDDASPGDGGPGDGMDDFIISRTQLAPMATHTFVELEVDWTRSLAYVGTREPGRCFDVIDFAVVPPAMIHRRGPPATGGSTCLGLLLVANDRLVVTSEGGGTVELWDLGADPRAGIYNRLASVPVPRPRRVTLAGGTKLYVARGSGSPGVQLVDLSTTAPYLALGASFASGPCPNSHNDVTHLATGLIVTGCSEDLSPVELVDDATLAGFATQDANNGGLSGFWSAARSSDGSLAVMGGWVSATLETDPGTRWKLRHRWDNAETYRDATILEPNGSPQLWAATGDGHLEVLTLDGAVPRVIHRPHLGAPGEAYGIEIDLASQRAAIAANRGTFILVDTSKLPVIDMTWPAF